MFKGRNLQGSVIDYDDTDTLVSEADEITLMRIDEAMAIARPSEIAATWVEEEYDQYAAGQEPLWEAKGDLEARSASIRAQGLEAVAAAAKSDLDGQGELIAKARAESEAASRILRPYTRRERNAKYPYWGRWLLLVLGDIAGIAGAAILRGEIITLAIIQATATGIAAVTAGLVGQDLRDMRLARKREKDPALLSEEEEGYAHLFRGADVGENLAWIMVKVGFAITVLVTAGIFALRTSVDGSIGGMVFGCLAAAICLASALNSYFYADEVSDLIESTDKDYKTALKRHQRLAKKPALRRYAEAVEEVNSIKAEHRNRGEAARIKMTGLKYRILRQSPGVVGHGPAPQSPSEEQPWTLFGEFEAPSGNGSTNSRTGG